MKKLWFYGTTFVLIACAYVHFNYAEPMALLVFFGTLVLMFFEGKNVGQRLIIFLVAWWFCAMDQAIVTESRYASETMYGFSLGWLTLLLFLERWKCFLSLRKERI